NLTRATFHGRNPVIAPLALTLFVWILLMNTLKIIPVDYGPELFKRLGVEYMKIVPTTDPNATLGMALGVFCLIIYYSIKVKGAG
ncbi:F0F1 ATP synthase subunit A, partial [Psychrobacter sp. SIMBA_152]